MSKLLFRHYFPYWPVSANHSWGRKGSVTFLSRETKEFRFCIDVELHLARWRHGFKGTYDGRVALKLSFYAPDNRRRDISNLEKQICDSFTQSGVWLDDSQIDKLTLERCEFAGKENSGFYAELWAI